jgi:hypothetical protein
MTTIADEPLFSPETGSECQCWRTQELFNRKVRENAREERKRERSDVRFSVRGTAIGHGETVTSVTCRPLPVGFNLLLPRARAAG